jgi:hypothetical protein
MEAAAMNKLVETGEIRPQLAQAIAEALDITLKAMNVVTVPMLDARLAQQDAKMEARFGALEKSIESTKLWATLLYAGLVIALFSAMAVDHHWLISREDQLMAQIQARSDASMAEMRTRSDATMAEMRARSDANFAQMRAQSDARFAAMEARSDQRFQQINSKLDKALASTTVS